MKKVLIYGVAMAFLCATGLAGVSMAADKGPAELHLGTKKPVTFPHAKHQEKNPCGTCHHGKGADGKQAPYVEGQAIGKCDSCHNKESGNRLASFKDAGHERCKGCHQKSGNKELTKCGTCHKK